MKPSSIKYHVLKALAEGDAPMTCAEIWEVMPEEKRPAAHEDSSREWANLTSHTATLYGDHYVDRRKRDTQWKPMEYWLAARGREELASNGDLPEDTSTSAPVPENPDADPAETAEEPNPSAIRTDLGLDDPEVDTGEALTDALTGIVSRLRDVERAADNLREQAVTEAEMEDRLQNSVGEGLLQEVETLKEAVNRLAQAQARQDGVGGGEFEPFIKRLREMDEQGYGLHEGEIGVEYGGNIASVRVKAKPKGKTDRKGPDESDGERVTVSKAADSVAENQEDMDVSYEEAPDDA
ncbi:hypothetical protein M197_gp85 [Haloarcula hispanica tailed virus 2]|uniref:Uncharacterized protein n=1 Tax=Haloarcula hispanica tailed virus 2 TaxID=1273751 RepID=R4T6C9_9CAUD|nr:hypothetical protein M197_gp85 [Haloarcula hispanica tailed virus 2]AGM11249.1 hypothetical protein HHTV2_85 [Haloarcula hispanica tailed virus 2]